MITRWNRGRVATAGRLRQRNQAVRPVCAIVTISCQTKKVRIVGEMSQRSATAPTPRSVAIPIVIALRSNCRCKPIKPPEYRAKGN